MLLYEVMFGKILLTAAVLVAAFLIIRMRLRRPVGAEARGTGGPVGSTRKAVRLIAYILVATMLGGSLLYLFLDWRADRQVVQVRVVNAYTGESVRYQARRGDVETRQFKTLDGRRVTLAEVERLELEEAE